MSEWVTSFTQWVFEYPPKRCPYNAVWLLHGWCQVKPLPSWHTFYAHHTTMYQFTVSRYLNPITLGACAFSCNPPPAFSVEWPGSFMCCCEHGGGMYTEMSQHRKLTLEKKTLLFGIKPTTFQSWVQCSTTEVSLLPFQITLMRHRLHPHPPLQLP